MSYGIYFWWYRFWKNFFYRVFNKKELSDLDISVITLIAGCINACATNPIWFINTRMTIAQGIERKSIYSTIKEIYEKEGITAFYKGVLPNMFLVINPIINFVIYENLKKFLLKKKCSLNAL